MSSRWRVMKNAPKDGSLIVAWGHNWGDPKLGVHVHIARWDGGFYSLSDAGVRLTHLQGWVPMNMKLPKTPPRSGEPRV